MSPLLLVNVHLPKQITENTEAAIKALFDAKPSSVSGRFVKSLTLSATMSPESQLIQHLISKINIGVSKTMRLEKIFS